jgi:predicted AAA+ superfamily ATPase
MVKRYLEDAVRADLQKKMVFVAGPRQVGKTTLARSLLPDPAGYLSWDVPEHREAILRRELPAAPALAFDEIHKYRSWRAYLKGIFDQTGSRIPILVTGSARLDYYRFGGDSLQGRYHMHRLHPLSVAELAPLGRTVLEDLLRLGGFPEPFLSGSETESRRWSREYRTRLVREDIASLERIADLGNLELLVLRLPELVGAPLSINAIRVDLAVSHDSAARWIAALERMYAIVRLSPFGAPRIRAVKKAQKHYHYDWALVPDMPRRFENLVAMHLLKWVHHLEDTQGLDMELRYFRDIDLREVDFVVMTAHEPSMLVEAKWSDAPIDKGIRYLKARFPLAKAWQISAIGTKDYVSPEGIRVCPAEAFLRGLV